MRRVGQQLMSCHNKTRIKRDMHKNMKLHKKNNNIPLGVIVPTPLCSYKIPAPTALCSFSIHTLYSEKRDLWWIKGKYPFKSNPCIWKKTRSLKHDWTLRTECPQVTKQRVRNRALTWEGWSRRDNSPQWGRGHGWAINKPFTSQLSY